MKKSNDIMKNELVKNLSSTITKTKELLSQNNEWQKRYAGYAKKIDEKSSLIQNVRESFYEWDPLFVYLNTTSVLNAKNSVRYDLRYLGQTVANLTGYKNGQHKLSTIKKQRETNLRDFDCSFELNNVDWADKEAEEFRRFFRKRKGPRNTKSKRRNEEHRLESLWLSELQESTGKDKALPYAKPVKIGKARFPMPTPLSASHKTNPVKYSGTHGGGIDILARVGTGGPNTYLCILELKSANDPPKYALRQAVAYTTFIRELLRSEPGQTWWRLFGFKSKVPKQLILYTACLMPSGQNNDYSFRDMELDIDGDIIRLHYIYFTEKDGKITDVNTSLKWS